MNRRDVLTAVGAAATGSLAGCTSSGPPAGTETVVDRKPDVTLEGVDGFGDDYPVDFEVEVTTGDFAGRGAGGEGSHPAAITVTLRNHADETKKYGLGHRAVFSTVYSDDRQYVLLIPDDEYTQVAPDCWKITEPLAFPAVVRITTIPSGESVSKTLELFTSSEADTCRPTGPTTFTETYAEFRPKDEYTPERRKERPVGFTLEITD